MESSPQIIQELFDASLRVVLVEAFSARSTRYDSGWRVLPFAIVAEFRGSGIAYEQAGADTQNAADTQSVAPGEAIIIPMGVAHRINYSPAQVTYTRYVHVRFLLSEAIDLLTLLDIPPVIARPAAKHSGDICESLTRVCAALSNSFSLTAHVQKKILELRLLEQIVGVAPLKATSRDFLSEVQRLSPVLQYIENHLAAPLRRDELAALIHLSPGYFDAVFKKTMRVTPQEYIKRLRIRRAQELLLQSEDSVAEIAASVGYREPFHFSRQFHTMCRLSPTAYRKQIRQSLFDK